MAAKTWDQLHTKISTDEEFTKEIAYKGMTCESPRSSLFDLLAAKRDAPLAEHDVIPHFLSGCLQALKSILAGADPPSLWFQR
jgi:hypothetical protein